MVAFEHLLQPGRIGSLRTKNRIIKNGTHNFFDTEDSVQNDRNIDFYDVLAQGGVGLIVVASAPLIDDTRGYRIDADEFIPGFARLAETIHRHDCPALVQLFHVGPMSPPFFNGPQPTAASSIPREESPRPQWQQARELTIPEIEEIVERFAGAGERVKKAGFDGVELNSATNHLLNSFLSRAWNRRNDAYGRDSLDCRTKIVTDIITEIKRRNGNDFVVISLFNGAEPGLRDGLTLRESREIARILEKAGADALEVRAEYYSWTDDNRHRESTQFPDIYFYPEPPEPLADDIEPSRHGVGASVPLAAAIKKVVSVPVIAVGRLDAEEGEKAIRRGNADFVSMNRLLFADPELPNKVAASRLEDIAPCTACITCFDLGEHGQPITCRVNAALGREREYKIIPAEHKKNVMIIGGGPAGMEAARIAALRGHNVTLYERERRPGGSLPLAATVKGFEREDLLGLARYLERQARTLGVAFKTGVDADRSIVEKEKPDVLIVATGGVHQIPKIPGIGKPFVVIAPDLHKKLKVYLALFGPRLLHRLTNWYMPLGKRVIVMGGGVQGCQVAELLVKRGRKVTIVSESDEIGEGLLDVLIKPYLLHWLQRRGATLVAGVKYEEVTDAGLVVSTKDGARQTIGADTILTALPLLPNTAFIDSLSDSAPEVYTIGDAKSPNMIIDAIADGSRIGRIA